MTAATTPRVAGAADATSVGRIFAAGFADDPTLTWVFSEPRRAAKLGAFFEFLATEALVPLGSTYVVEGAAASWTPPKPPHWPEDRGKRLSAMLDANCTSEDRHRLGLLDRAQAEHHPSEPHWYLGVIATVPHRRGAGLGTSLLAHTLEVVDAAGLPAYLESTNPRNVSLYERHGFRVTGRIDLPDGPSLIPMWRD